MRLKDLQAQAYRQGRKAQQVGIKAIAVLDPDVMKLIRRHEGQASPILKAWARGWHTANAGAPLNTGATNDRW